MDSLDLLVDKLDALGVLVVVVVALLAREWLGANKKTGNPNGLIKAFDRLEQTVRDHNEKSSERMVRILERLENMGQNTAAIQAAGAQAQAAMFQDMGEIARTCATICERLRARGL